MRYTFKSRSFQLLLLFLAGACQAPGAAADPVAGPLEPAETLKHFQLAPGLQIELVAAEPVVVDPVAVRFDERGRMWVVEMRDYPHGPAAGEPPKSRIRILQDRDGDGVYETGRTFADKLVFPTGLQPWRGGAIVTLAGRVAYMQDTTGDGRADRIETWYEGFAEENTQLRANHPTLAMDNHVYIANGLRGGEVRDVRKKEKPVSLRGKDFRFDPRTGDFSAVTGMGQFGLAFDDFGRRFVCSNRNPLKHIVIEDRYLQYNPLARVASVAHDVAAAGEGSRIYPISRAWTTSNLHAGQFTAACGVTLFRGDALPEAFHGNAFICDPTGNLVHREVLAPDGATFTSRPAREGVEFLASPDEWFRPVNLASGPDGSLYVVDMYRAVIEHPQFMPAELKQRPDLLEGDDRGRIYRIVAENGAARAVEPLAGLAPSELVEQLEQTNAWRRETAARLLLEMNDDSVAPRLEKLARDGKTPPSRAQALWLLAGAGALRESIVSRALRDAHPGVREQAALLAERWLNESQAMQRAVLALAEDPAPRVRFQAALSLATWDAKEAESQRRKQRSEGLRRIAGSSTDDQWTRAAIAIAAGERASELALLLIDEARRPSAESRSSGIELIHELASQAGAGKHEPRQVRLLRHGLAAAGDSSPQIAISVLLGLAEGLRRRGSSLDALVRSAGDDELARQVDRFFVLNQSIAADVEASIDRRIQAIETLALSPASSSVLAEIASSEAPVRLRIAAISALARSPSLEPWEVLLGAFPSESPGIRQAILDGTLGRPERTELLLAEIAAGRIKPSELGRISADRLLKHRDADIRQRAAKLLADAVPADRRRVLAEYQSALSLPGEPSRGLSVFKKNCAACHRIGEVGVNVAPDISDSRTKTPAQILTDIVQPNRAIDANYVNYTLATTDGRVLSGILAEETSTSITLKQPEAKTVTLARDEIEQIRSTGVSLMPEGLEKEIPQQAMADLIAYIKNWRYLDGRVPAGR